MAKNKFPLREISIETLFISGDENKYEIPIYQRNYAWEKDEITALVQDVYDSFKKDSKQIYYIGTLVSYKKDDGVFEIIDGQQRLTTIRIILATLDIHNIKSNLTYRARKKSDDTLKYISNHKDKNNEDIEKDEGIESGYKYAKTALDEIVQESERKQFEKYFRNNVHIIHYQVPKDIDLNHYFEIMNSRGEQLEKHEIVKANLMEKLDNDKERTAFNDIWECCSQMSVYVQQNLNDNRSAEKVFGNSLCEFRPDKFDDIVALLQHENNDSESSLKSISIDDIINPKSKVDNMAKLEEANEKKDSFQPIIDFPNFLLIVLKITCMSKENFIPANFNLDDKELLKEFDKAKLTTDEIKKFANNLLKARFLLDNYIVHHSNEDDTIESNPWKLQVWHKDKDTKSGQLRNLCDREYAPFQDKLVHLLSMFEVSFTARQRKNYLFYCLLYLMKKDNIKIDEYVIFVEGLADRYFNMVYLDGSKLNAINTPLPGSFDDVMLDGRNLNTSELVPKSQASFIDIYGDGSEQSRGVPLFVFSYMDYKLWKMYDMELRGNRLKEGSGERRRFFEKLGCGDFGLKVFDQFYFSRTRRSLEHYYPQALAGDGKELNKNEINCFGNYAMIGSAANSMGSDWPPKEKIGYYLESPNKIDQISVASLKFRVMMQICSEMQKWEFEQIKEHQEKMVDILVGK